eukprot:gene15006-biopygen6638
MSLTNVPGIVLALPSRDTAWSVMCVLGDPHLSLGFRPTCVLPGPSQGSQRQQTAGGTAGGTAGSGSGSGVQGVWE